MRYPGNQAPRNIGFYFFTVLYGNLCNSYSRLAESNYSTRYENASEVMSSSWYQHLLFSRIPEVAVRAALWPIPSHSVGQHRELKKRNINKLDY